MSKIYFNGEFPSSVQAQVASVVVQVEWMTPIWTQRLELTFDAGMTHAVVTCEVMLDYRIVRLTISPLFLQFDELRQFELLTHEMVHCFNLPLIVLVREIVDLLCEKDGNLNTVLNRQLDEKMEMITQDFAYVIAKRVKGANAG